MPLTALLRNLGKLSALGIGVNAGGPQEKIVQRLTDPELLKQHRIHPLAILTALTTYRTGHGVRGNLKWRVVGAIVKALEKAFELSFASLPKVGGNGLIAVDVSGSMVEADCNGIPNLSVSAAAAAQAKVLARQFAAYKVCLFDTEVRQSDLELTYHNPLADWQKAVEQYGGGTDCAAPFIWAQQQPEPFDYIVLLTDSETWAGDRHPFQAFDEYRQTVNPNCRCVVVQMQSNRERIAPPDDPAYLSVIGFDLATPDLIAAFVRGEF